ncbi:MAG: hypothetical protein A2170_07310 [Deltaproteobacteria bacterium RBG_13_53_10]|nr:MAG: hypothetical protein A2170_07310 [Deltaproteobacteria bacterium RBG_13_53_10]
MRLTSEEEKMLKGYDGPVVQQAMEFQVRLGEYYGAEELVQIHQVSQSLSMHEDYGLKIVERFAQMGARVRCYTTGGLMSMDANQWQEIGSPEEEVKKQWRLHDAYVKLGYVPSYSNIPFLMPHFGEHVAWVGSNTCLLVNSFFGARTNLESPVSGLMVALTGRAPKYGFHLKENRYGTTLVHVKASIEDPTNWDALGYCIGKKIREYDHVPVFLGLPEMTSMGERQRFDSTLVSYGTMGMYHIVGATPEARTLEDAFGGKQPRQEITVTMDDLRETYKTFSEDQGDVDAVTFGGHHLTIDEFPGLISRLVGKKVHENVRLWIFTCPQYKVLFGRLGYDRIVENAGGRIIYDTSVLFMSPRYFAEKKGVRTVVSDSAKMCHYLGGYGMTPVFRTIDGCIKAAVTGRLEE